MTCIPYKVTLSCVVERIEENLAKADEFIKEEPAEAIREDKDALALWAQNQREKAVNLITSLIADLESGQRHLSDWTAAIANFPSRCAKHETNEFANFKPGGDSPSHWLMLADHAIANIRLAVASPEDRQHYLHLKHSASNPNERLPQNADEHFHESVSEDEGSFADEHSHQQFGPRRNFPPAEQFKRANFNPSSMPSSNHPLAAASIGQLQGSQAAHTLVQLPKLKLQPFNGNQNIWPQFWQTFHFAIHSRDDLPNQVKLTYLLGLLPSGSAAAQAVSGFDCSAANYPLLIDTLVSRFGDQQRHTDKLLDELLNHRLVQDDTPSLRAFVDLVENNCRQLEKANALTDGLPLLRTLKSKLPSQILTELCRAEHRSGESWDLSSWRAELDCLISEREEIEQVTASCQPKQHYNQWHSNVQQSKQASIPNASSNPWHKDA